MKNFFRFFLFAFLASCSQTPFELPVTASLQSGDMFAFVHHKLVGKKSAAGVAWSNTKSCKYAGTATATAGRTNWGMPTAWCGVPSSTAFSVSYWFKRNGDDGALLTSADQTTNTHFRMGVGGTAINNVYAGGNFVSSSCGTSITNATWFLVTVTWSASNSFNMYVGNSSTPCISAFTPIGTDVCTRDWIFNTLRSTTNSDTAFGEWALHNLDELTFWSTTLSGTDHVNLQSGGHAVDPTTHAQAASLINYYRCGDDPTDSTTLLNDQIGSSDGTHSGSDGVTYPSDVP